MSVRAIKINKEFFFDSQKKSPGSDTLKLEFNYVLFVEVSAPSRRASRPGGFPVI